jgi:hypothetical protein
MRTVAEIYAAYRIMPGLQLHQLRVAAVVKMVCGSVDIEVDADALVRAALFHDMGNIIKSDLDIFPALLEPEGKEYWQKVKDEFIAMYGTDEHAAALSICNQVGLSEDVCALVDGTRFSRLEAARDDAPFEPKILKYADLRAAPFGILPLAGRLEEGRLRYAEKKGYNTPEGREQFDRSARAAAEIERQIFAHCSIAPGDINDLSVAPFIEELRNTPIQ